MAAIPKQKNMQLEFQKISVLVFESQAADRDLIEKLLTDSTSQKFELTFVDSLQKGLELLKTWRGDLIFADLALQDSQGWDTFVQIRNAASRLPVVVLSSLQDEKAALEAVRSGAEDYLVKATLNSTMLPRVFRYAIERKKSHEATYLAEEKYRTVFENSAVAITLVDEQERLLSWNEYAEKMLGMTHADLYLRNIKTLYTPESWKKIRELSIRKKGMQNHFEAQMIRKAGALFDVDISISVLKDSDGNVTGSIGIMEDITERKRLEKLKDEFISTVSHEMRTPMTIIREGVSQVLDGILGEPTEEQTQVLGLTLQSIDRLGRIINDLLDISKLEAGKMEIHKEVLDMVEIATSIQKAFSSMAQDKGLTIEVEHSHAHVQFEGDRDRIIQILMNLVGNALKFTNQGKIRLQILNKGETVECRVVDTGRGIAQEDLSHVFEKFRQFGREEGPGERGTGLGLTICKKIVELHQGKIWLESQLGKGTVFAFVLPKKLANV